MSQHGDVATGPNWVLHCGRWQDVLAHETCDALITDPPYSERTHSGHAGAADRGQWTDYNGAPTWNSWPRCLASGVVTPAENERVSSELRESIAAQRSLLELLERERGAMRPRAVRGGAA